MHDCMSGARRGHNRSRIISLAFVTNTEFQRPFSIIFCRFKVFVKDYKMFAMSELARNASATIHFL